MAIYSNSRYYNQPIVQLNTWNGLGILPAVFRPQPPLGAMGTYLHYTVKSGDRLDRLASDYYGDPTLWWVIADANPEIFYPDNLIKGSIIRIPQQS